jgi:hypothetical protein
MPSAWSGVDLTDVISEQAIRRQDRWRIVVGSESLSADDDASALTKMGLGLFKFQMNLSQPAQKYLFPETLDLDLHILKVGVPVVFKNHGAQVYLPKILEPIPPPTKAVAR